MLGVCCVLLVAFSFVINGQRTDNTCPDGGEIYDQGMTASSKLQVVDFHNNLRLRIAQGILKGQPRGVDLKKISYDDGLGRKAQITSNTCNRKALWVNDDRWDYVSQTTHRYCNAAKEIKHNWKRVLDSWYSTISDFTYPNKYKNIKTPYFNPYTKMVWAHTSNIGCDYISFYNKSNSNYPYCKIYTCNYAPGPSGSVPYKVGCDDLC